MRRAAQLPGVVGIKDSSGRHDLLPSSSLALFQDRPDFTLLIGPEELLAEAVLLGGHGGVNGGANLHPRLYVSSTRPPGPTTSTAWPDSIGRSCGSAAGLYTLGGPGAGFPKGLKCALSILGICVDFLAEPFHRFNPPERARVHSELRALGLLTDRAG